MIKINREFQRALIPLSKEEYDQLEKNIVRDGCREPLTLWNDQIIDGHNRYKICQEHDLKFQTVSIELDDMDSVFIWILKNQIGRRNLTVFQKTELALKFEPQIAAKALDNKQKAGERYGENHPKELCQNSDKALESIDTKKEIAKIAEVSHDTVAKVKKINEKASEEVKENLRKGETSINAEYKRVKAQERKDKQAEAQQTALKLVTDEKLWTATDDQTIVECDVIITDPPYGILTEEWEPSDLEEFTRTWASKWSEAGADFILTFWSQRYLWEGRKWFDESFEGYEFQQLLIWHYANNKKPQSRKGFKQTWEPIFFYRKIESKKEIKNSGDEWGDGLNEFDCHVAAVPQSNFNNENAKQHPAQKPLAVMNWLVNATSQPNELICDPFMGSGTTGIAATQQHRKFYGIEKDGEYLQLARSRLALYGQ